jgi:large subunit ribosomal protein L25
MELKAEKRAEKGKKPSLLRKEGVLPAVVYGGEKNAQPLAIKEIEFEKAYREGGEATIIDLVVNGHKEKVLIADVQHDPFGKVLHADLRRVEAGEKLTTTVAIEPTGSSPAVKEGEGILLTLLDEVEVECFPQDLPSEIKVDISTLKKVDDAIAIKDLPVDRKKVKILEHKATDLVLKISYAEMEEEEEEETTTPTEEKEEEAVEAVEATKEKEASPDKKEEDKEEKKDA